ncbi:MAG: hypothetical protein M1118_00325 [Chloroflexi bacterium]|nr:hypothetical protein [Chloroflexota bacterium]
MKPLCVGHRGAAGLAPENTLLAFQQGIRAGANVIECDVHMTADGDLVLLHDVDVSRTTNGTGVVSDLTFAEVRSLNAAHHWRGAELYEHVPTLREFVDCVSHRAIAQVELKVGPRGRYPGLEERVAAELKTSLEAREAQLITFDPEYLRTLKQLAVPWLCGLLLSGTDWRGRLPQDFVTAARECGADFLSVQCTLVTLEVLHACQDAGLPVATWTVNDQQEMSRLARLPLYAITSDVPHMLRAVLDGDSSFDSPE